MGADRDQSGAKKASDKIKDRAGVRDERKAQLEERERLERKLEETYGDSEDAIRGRAAFQQ